MAVIVVKWENCLAVRLPAHITRQAGISAGDRVEITASHNGTVIISPARLQYSLDALLDQITPQNLYKESDWGEPRGSEVW